MGKYGFDGAYTHSIDQRKRVFIPADFRSRLGEEFIVCTPLGSGKCVVIYPLSEWERYYENVQSSCTGINRTRAERYLSSTKRRTSADKQGRITLTEAFCNKAELENEAYIVGIENRIEIWNYKNWQAEMCEFEESQLDFIDNLSL